jgi:hypothetical protein
MLGSITSTALAGLPAGPAVTPLLRPSLGSSNEISAAGLQQFLERFQTRAGTGESCDAMFLAPLHLVARSRGRKLVADWMEGVSPFRAIRDVLSVAANADMLELCIVTGRTKVTQDDWQTRLSRDANGRFGLELTLNGDVQRISPFESIATNRPLEDAFQQYLEQRQISDEQFFALGGAMHLLACRQFLLQCGKHPKVVETYRGCAVVEPDMPAHALADDVIARLARWFTANIGDDGSLPYKYWPSSGEYSEADNPIRRLMASIVLNRLATALDRQDLKSAARRNLQYNLRRFYRVEHGHGVIVWDDKVKLGALAMAGLAIIESPFASSWQTELREIRRTIDALWQPSGAFRTFLRPAERNDNQNFYPGEALLFWATSLEQERDPALLERAMKSFTYYRAHFRGDPNPAFVPWHTQAARILFRITGETALRDFILEMNDWLLSHQQWGGATDRDHWGRFYSPHRPEFGVPHASATGVYLEGLADSLHVAREMGDEARAARYALALQRGIRSLAQLQYRDEFDAFYIANRKRVMGAIRTESDDNEIRIDNMQHALVALLKFRGLKLSGNVAKASAPAGRARAA